MTNLNIGGFTKLRNYVKFNAKVGKWFVRGAEGEVKEIEQPTFVIDFYNFSTGWLRFREGQAPDRVMDPHVGHGAEKPGEGFERGFVVMVHSPRYFGGTVEFSSASKYLRGAITDLYGQYEVGKVLNPGKLPVIACTGSQAMNGKYGTNYRPTFTITHWVDRPANLPSVSPVEACDIWQGNTTADPKVTAQHVPTPAPKATPPADSDAPF